MRVFYLQYNSLSKDSNSYFIACHKDIESSLYTDTIKHLYYLGKYDKDLNQVWLKILGGDREVFDSWSES